MLDRFRSHTPGLTAPPTGGVQIVPDDSTDLPQIIRALNVGTTGSVHVTTAEGTSLVLYLAAGVMFPIRATRVWAAGTTAASIVGLW